MNIPGKHVLLRAIELQDLPRLQQWANDPALQRLLGGWHFPTSMQDQHAWFATLSCQSANQRFAIEHQGELLGTVNLVSIDWKNRHAFEGLMLGDPASRGKGYGRDALMALMRYAFDELGLARLDTDIIEYNDSSLKLHEKCGWLLEGKKSNGYFRDGRHWDKLILGITRERYHEHAAHSGYWQ